MSNTEQQLEQRKPACKSCGVPLNGDDRRQVYCTAECMRKWRNETRHRRVTAACEHCGKEYQSLAYPSGKPRGKFCSRACCADAFKASGVFKGENNPRWLGGVSNDNMRYNRRQRERQPERVAARTATMKAIASGRLVRQPCEVCGTAEKVEAHHDDYTKALEVRWLCVVHHDEHHANERRLKRAQRAAAGEKVPRLRKYRPRVKPDDAAANDEQPTAPV